MVKFLLFLQVLRGQTLTFSLARALELALGVPWLAATFRWLQKRVVAHVDSVRLLGLLRHRRCHQLEVNLFQTALHLGDLDTRDRGSVFVLIGGGFASHCRIRLDPASGRRRVFLRKAVASNLGLQPLLRLLVFDVLILHGVDFEFVIRAARNHVSVRLLVRAVIKSCEGRLVLRSASPLRRNHQVLRTQLDDGLTVPT